MLKKILWCFVACFVLWFSGLAWFTKQIPQALTEVPQADAIVILTGGKGRLEYGLRLLAEGKGSNLFITGVGSVTNTQALLDRLPDDLKDQIASLPPSAITLGHTAENTIGNALETYEWAKQHAFKRLLLVTSNYHMPRSLSEFGEVMPDITWIPAPVMSDSGFEYRLLLSEYHKYLASKLRHWLVTVI